MLRKLKENTTLEYKIKCFHFDRYILYFLKKT